jgi:ribonuclease Z
MYREQIVEQIAGVDVLYHEATYTEKDLDKCKKHTHSTAKQAATIAQKAGVGKLVIGHFSAREDDHAIFLDEAKEVFSNTVLAVERTTIDI